MNRLEQVLHADGRETEGEIEDAVILTLDGNVSNPRAETPPYDCEVMMPWLCRAQ